MKSEWVQTSLDCEFKSESIQRVKKYLREKEKRKQEEKRKAAEEAAKKAEERKPFRFMLGILTKECPAAGDLWKRLEPFANRKTVLKRFLFDRMLWWQLKRKGGTRQRVYYLPYWQWELTDEYSEYFFPETSQAVIALREASKAFEMQRREKAPQ